MFISLPITWAVMASSQCKDTSRDTGSVEQFCLNHLLSNVSQNIRFCH